MQPVYAIFDDEEVQRIARRQMGQLTGLAAAAVLVTVLGIALAVSGAVKPVVVVTGVVVLWVLLAAWTGRRRRQLRRRVWCVRLSNDGIEGYDYARHKIQLDWSDVRRVDLARDGLTIEGPAPCVIEVPYLFDDFATLSHQVVRFAERHGIALSIDGTSLEKLDVYHLFPILTNSSFGSRPGSEV